ncbi:MAG: hypothetical protein N3D12_03610 [Candidatus Methanomethyliaceae archaeon]|nr:hypothetical protein [Candidatus Methanomethyliaceae archaeon]
MNPRQDFWDLSQDREGLGGVYKLLGKISWRKKGFEGAYGLARETVSRFEEMLYEISKDSRCMHIRELNKKRLLKRKHYVYATYLAVLSSVPILRDVPKEVLLDTLVAKVAMITSIKTLDNINDLWHTDEEAKSSLNRQLNIFLGREKSFREDDTEVGMAENFTYRLAEITYDVLKRRTNSKGRMFQKYLQDFEKYIKGQTDSMLQKKAESLDIRKFLKEVNEKGVGNVWIDIDFCILEGLMNLSEDELKSMELIGKCIDLVFKGCNVYDDVADLEEDLKSGIYNSVVYLAMDKGWHYMEKDRLKLLNKAKIEAVRLGDLLFLKGLRHLEEAKRLTKIIDTEGIKYGLKILRIFSMRKWLTRVKNPLTIASAVMVKVTPSVTVYSEYI